MSNPFYTEETMAPRLSALVVNYNSGQFALACVRSLRQQWVAAGYEPERLEVIVVDNASPIGQGYWLDVLQQEGARVMVQPHNLGYAGAIQSAFEASHGGPNDYVAILNPDLVFLDGSVREMIRYLEAHPEVGAVGPVSFMDEELQLRLPSIPVPTAREEFWSLAARVSTRIARHLANRRSRRSRKMWSSELPVETDMLPGACLFMSRDVVMALDCLLDRRYPLYYEDADLCRRLQARGLTLVTNPRAQVVHHWSRSAGVGKDFDGEPRRRWELSRGAYLERWTSPLARAGLSILEWAIERLPARMKDRSIHRFVQKSPTAKPSEMSLPGPGPWVMEISMTPTFTLSAGCYVEGDTWTLPPAAWDWLFKGRYYMRAVHPASGRVCGAWTFTKSTDARQDAVVVQPPVGIETREVA